jgi:hypothetical protein
MLVLRRLADAVRRRRPRLRRHRRHRHQQRRPRRRPHGPRVARARSRCIEAAWRDAGHRPRAPRLRRDPRHRHGRRRRHRVRRPVRRPSGDAPSRRRPRLVQGQRRPHDVGRRRRRADPRRPGPAPPTIPPMAGFESAKPELGLDGGPFRVPTRPSRGPPTRVAAVSSSFGFGGTNGHVVLSAAPAPHPVGQLGSGRSSQPELVLCRRATGPTPHHAARLALGARRRPDAHARGRRPHLGVRRAVSCGTARRSSPPTAPSSVAARGLATGGKAAGLVTAEAPPRPRTVALSSTRARAPSAPGCSPPCASASPSSPTRSSAADATWPTLLRLPLSHLLYPDHRAAASTPTSPPPSSPPPSTAQPALLAVASP